MVDLQPVFARARELAASAVTTSGCTVRVSTQTATVNPDTLTTARSETTIVEGPALVRHAADDQGSLPGLEVRVGDYVVLMLPDTAAPPTDAVVTVVTAIGGAPTGRLGTVRGSVRDAAGALLRVLVRP